MGFVGIGSDKGNSENLEKAWLVELAKIQKDGATDKELQKAKNSYIAGAIATRETNDGKATLIERAITYNGDAKAVNREIDAIQAVTIADIKRVMNQYFKPNSRVVINYSQAPAKAEEVAQ